MFRDGAYHIPHAHNLYCVKGIQLEDAMLEQHVRCLDETCCGYGMGFGVEMKWGELIRCSVTLLIPFLSVFLFGTWR